MTEEISEYLGNWVQSLDFSSCLMPESPLIAKILSKLSDSGVGPDGIPYSAWLAAGADGVKTLLELFLYFCWKGHLLPAGLWKCFRPLFLKEMNVVLWDMLIASPRIRGHLH